MAIALHLRPQNLGFSCMHDHQAEVVAKGTGWWFQRLLACESLPIGLMVIYPALKEMVL